MMDKLRILIKKYKLQFICAVGGFVLFALVSAVQPGKAEDISTIERAGYGSRNTESLYVDGLEEEPVHIDVSVEPRKYTDDEIDGAMDECINTVIDEALAGNTSLDEISKDMELPEYSQKYGFTMTWTPEDRELISSTGTVKNKELKEAKETVLNVSLSDGEHTKRYSVPVTILPLQLTEPEKRLNGLMGLIADADRKARYDQSVSLPGEYEGRRLRFRDSEDMSYHFIWIMGLVFAVLLYLRDRENEKTDLQKKYRQMQMDYPEIVSKLLVFVGAGLSVRMAWNAIACDYEKDMEINGRAEVRHAYEELCKANTRLQTGAPEGAVYREYGRECHSKQYMKLASLLEQNRRSGLSNMKNLLQLEMVEAWEERKNLALRQGEEASTKLLIPLVMMLVIVMVMIMIPALMGFI